MDTAITEPLPLANASAGAFVGAEKLDAEYQQFWQRAQAVLARDPQAREFHELRKAWSNLADKARKLERQAAAAKSKADAMYEKVKLAKSVLSAEAREALS